MLCNYTKISQSNSELYIDQNIKLDQNDMRRLKYAFSKSSEELPYAFYIITNITDPIKHKTIKNLLDKRVMSQLKGQYQDQSFYEEAYVKEIKKYFLENGINLAQEIQNYEMPKKESALKRITKNFFSKKNTSAKQKQN